MDRRQTTRSFQAITERLPTVDGALLAPARRVIDDSLSVVPSERVVLVGDAADRELLDALLLATRFKDAKSTTFVLEDVGTRPLRGVPAAILAAFDQAQASVVVASARDDEATFRAELAGAATARNHRHAQLLGLSRGGFIAGLAVDPHRMERLASALRARVRPRSHLRVRCPAGTDLEIALDATTRWVEQIGVVRPGRAEILPAGELFVTPETARGVLAARVQSGGRDTPVRLVVEAGTVREVESPDRAAASLISTFVLARDQDRIGHVGFGLNVALLEATGTPTLDRTRPGLYVGLGRAPRDVLSLATASADVDVDGTPLLRAGRYLVG